MAQTLLIRAVSVHTPPMPGGGIQGDRGAEREGEVAVGEVHYRYGHAAQQVELLRRKD
ncbi:MAG: hypothetical protein OEV17_04420 [Nitrospira sp.]|nr:hypothetical protein [Nitrospira sp.]